MAKIEPEHFPLRRVRGHFAESFVYLGKEDGKEKPIQISRLRNIRGFGLVERYNLHRASALLGGPVAEPIACHAVRNRLNQAGNRRFIARPKGAQNLGVVGKDLYIDILSKIFEVVTVAVITPRDLNQHSRNITVESFDKLISRLGVGLDTTFNEFRGG